MTAFTELRKISAGTKHFVVYFSGFFSLFCIYKCQILRKKFIKMESWVKLTSSEVFFNTLLLIIITLNS
jgi:hypothetical protein